MTNIKKKMTNYLRKVFFMIYCILSFCCFPQCRCLVSWDLTNTNKLDPLPERGDKETLTYK